MGASLKVVNFYNRFGLSLFFYSDVSRKSIVGLEAFRRNHVLDLLL